MVISTENKVLAGILVATVIVIVGGALLASSRPEKTSDQIVNVEQLVRSDDPIKGPSDAKVTVVEFGDFQCPACGVLHPALLAAKQNNAQASVRFVYRQFPLTNTHQFAQEAAEASLAAQAQGKFWEYHDLLFVNQQSLARADLVRYAETLGLNLDEFTRALDEHTWQAAVNEDLADGRALGVRGTPTLYINGVQYAGQYSAAELQKAIDSALQS